MSLENQKDSRKRHCSYCLLENDKASVCAKCQRRAYCSKECQKMDWSQTGQFHKKWCGLEYGEEDLDWRVEEVPGKGLGVVALRDFQKLERIMVDRGYTLFEAMSKPHLKTLVPTEGSPFDKFERNVLGCGEYEGVVGFRMSRVNHACLSNAAHFYDPDTKTKILHATKPIKAGDEICISYTGFLSLDNNFDKTTFKRELFKRWKIRCPDTCECNDDNLWKLEKRMRTLDEQIFSFVARDPLKAFNLAKELLKLDDEASFSTPMTRQRTLYDAYQMGITSRRTYNEAVTYLKQATDIVSQTISPTSSCNAKFRQYLNNPKSHPNYLISERMLF